jgi:hypothetical protein
MPLTYSIELNESLILAIAGGTVTNQDLSGYVSSLAKDARVKPGMKELIDLRGAVEAEVTSNGLLSLATFSLSQKERFRGIKCAVVADRDLAFGLARMYEAYSEGEGIPVDRKVFREFDDACKWLGIDPTDIRQCLRHSV